MLDGKLEARLERAYLKTLFALPHFAVTMSTKGIINRPLEVANQLEGGPTADGRLAGLVSIDDVRRHQLYARLMICCLATTLPHRYPARDEQARIVAGEYYLGGYPDGMKKGIFMSADLVREYALQAMLDDVDVIDTRGNVRIDMSQFRQTMQSGVCYDIVAVYYQSRFVNEHLDYLRNLFRLVTQVLRKTPGRATPFFSPVVLRDFTVRFCREMSHGILPAALDKDDAVDLARGLYAVGAFAKIFVDLGGEQWFCENVARCRMIDPANPGVIPEGEPIVKPFVASKLPGERAGSGGKYRVPPGVKAYTEPGEGPRKK